MTEQKFTIYAVKDVRPLIKSLNYLSDEEKDDLKLKKFGKKSDEVECYVFSKKAFKTYRENSEVHIVGRIRKRQKRYKDESPEDKNDKNIIGRVDRQFKEESSDDGETVKHYDLKESKDRCVWGYGWLGGKDFVEITRFNFLIFLIPLLLVLILGIILSSCPKEPADILDINDGDDEVSTTADADIPEYPNVYVVAFPETVTLTEDNKFINFWNLSYNYGNYYLQYEVYIDGEKLEFVTDEYNDYMGEVITTTADENRQVSYDFWDILDAGTYDLRLVVTSYDWDTYNEAQNADSKDEQIELVEEARRPSPTTLVTRLVIEK